ncbi:MAG: hypothetical protein ACR2IN_06870 [Thermoleophilaceae bacterium]|nr:hypothetical protein [Thermoleophilaceae bacterium]
MAEAPEARDEWRVEAELDEPDDERSLSERLRALELDDQARERLSDRVIVTRDGPRVFLYAGDEGAAREAERVMRDLLAADGLSATVSLTRWHPVEEDWKDASAPLPTSEAELEAERERRLAAETREVAEEGEFDWEVRVELEGHRATADLAERLEAEGLHVVRRWRYLLVGVLTEEGGSELADRILAEAPPGASARVEPRFSEPTHPLLVFFESR